MTFPDNPFGNLSEGMQDFFWEVTGTEYLDTAADESMAQALFAVGFGYTADEYESMGIDPDVVSQAREDFFDFMGLEYDDFDWEGWREEMGYEEH